jgi:hypothetical protein
MIPGGTSGTFVTVWNDHLRPGPVRPASGEEATAAPGSRHGGEPGVNCCRSELRHSEGAGSGEPARNAQVEAVPPAGPSSAPGTPAAKALSSATLTASRYPTATQ